jgi:hypothetical protein
MVAVWLAGGLTTLTGGIGLFAYHGAEWLAQGLWRPLALADWVGVPATSSLLGLNALLELAFGLPLAVDLILVGLLALLVGRNIDSWRALKQAHAAKAALPNQAKAALPHPAKAA